MLNVIQTPPTGWRCPSCSRCYSPQTTMCFYCPATYTTTPTTWPMLPNTYPPNGTPGYLPGHTTITCKGNS